MVRHLKALALIIACCGIGCAAHYVPLDVVTFPEAPVRIIVSAKATRQLEQLADHTRSTRKEQAACVTTYALIPAGDKLVVSINEIGPSRPYDSDSVKVWTLDEQPFCDGDAASIHTHIIPNATWGAPSQWDMQHAYDWTRAPFKVLLSVAPHRPSKLTVYGLR